MEGKGFSFILIIVVAFLSLALCVLAGYVFFGSSGQKTVVVENKQASTVRPDEAQMKTLNLFEGKMNFNLKKTDDKQIAVIMVSCELVYDTKPKGVKNPIETKLELYKAEVKQMVGTYFQNMTLEEASNPETKKKAGEELTKQINALLLTSEKDKNAAPIVYDVVFDQWFYQ